MLKIDRHSYILNELKKKHLVRVNRLANDMKVTEMTIRRDLKELEDYGHLTRIHGGAKLNPDEQRRYLGTFEERVLGYADIDTANSPQLEKGFLSILENLQEKAEPLFVKISPKIEFDKQVFYLKEAKETNSQATIVSEEHTSSPFGLIVHSAVSYTHLTLPTIYSV